MVFEAMSHRVLRLFKSLGRTRAIHNQQVSYVILIHPEDNPTHLDVVSDLLAHAPLVRQRPVQHASELGRLVVLRLR